MTRKIGKLPPELTHLLFEAGHRKIVLLEGIDDLYVFNEWFDSNDIFFHSAGGCKNIKIFLQELLPKSPQKEIYGIIARDFHTDEEVQASLNDKTSHLFILTRYALENYLLEPAAVWEELRLIGDKDFKDATAMETKLLKICGDLKTLIAANWVIFESSTETFVDYNIKEHKRQEIIEQLAKKLDCEIENAKSKVAKKESMIASKLDNLENAYQMINGKQILNQILFQCLKKREICKIKVHFRNLLVRTVKNNGLPVELVEIITKITTTDSKK